MAATALSTLLGFGREIVLAHFYGTRSEMDAFLNASTVPTILFGVFSYGLVGALVPTFSEYLSQGRSDEVRKLGSTVLNALFFLLSGVAVLGWLLAPAFVPVVAHGFPLAEQGLVVQMVRWLMPSIVATCLAGVCAAMLNANHHFVTPALQGVALNLVTIGLVVALNRELGIFALVLGSVARHHRATARADPCDLAARALLVSRSICAIRGSRKPGRSSRRSSWAQPPGRSI